MRVAGIGSLGRIGQVGIGGTQAGIIGHVIGRVIGIGGRTCGPVVEIGIDQPVEYAVLRKTAYIIGVSP